ncbi:MAG: hypothetical protein J0H49_22810 [Acidobacteria bacterium]|nr:hypothetical protein [Acidobacteriota bacterium]
MVLGEQLSTAYAGLLAGLALALGQTRFLAGFVYSLAPNDPPTICVAATILIVVALCAGCRPARRAAQIQPLAALREE